MVLTASSDLSIRIFGKDGINPRTLKGHTKGVTSLAIIGVGKQVISGSRDGTVRVWDVGAGKEVKKWEIPGRTAVEDIVLLEDLDGKTARGMEEEERVVLAATATGVHVIPWSTAAGKLAPPSTMIDTWGRGEIGVFRF